jgi:hypothetical protein
MQVFIDLPDLSHYLSINCRLRFRTVLAYSAHLARGYGTTICPLPRASLLLHTGSRVIEPRGEEAKNNDICVGRKGVTPCRLRRGQALLALAAEPRLFGGCEEKTDYEKNRMRSGTPAR